MTLLSVYNLLRYVAGALGTLQVGAGGTTPTGPARRCPRPRCSNAFLIGIAFAPGAGAAVALLLARQLLSQMDVPTREAYVMAVVEHRKREAAASLTNLARALAQSVSPALTGWAMMSLALSAPFVLGGD